MHPSHGSAGVWEGSGRRSSGPSSWPRSRSSPRSGAGSQSPQPRPCSSGSTPWCRLWRRIRSARGARPEYTVGGHHDAMRYPPTARLCIGIFLPIFRWGIDSSSSSDGPSGGAAGMEANKMRLTLDRASTLQRWLKGWRSRASACAEAVKPPSVGRPAKERLIPRRSAVPCAIANTRWKCLPGEMPSVPG